MLRGVQLFDGLIRKLRQDIFLPDFWAPINFREINKPFLI